VAVVIGGSLGTLARWGVAKLVPVGANGFPWATLWTNLSGSFVLGLLLTLVLERWPPTRYVRPFAAVGFIGSYTTWSTLMVELDRLAAHGRVPVAATYAAVSLAGGLVAVYVGIALGRWRPGAARGRPG
jgi:CrcB protein